MTALKVSVFYFYLISLPLTYFFGFTLSWFAFGVYTASVIGILGSTTTNIYIAMRTDW